MILSIDLTLACAIQRFFARFFNSEARRGEDIVRGQCLAVLMAITVLCMQPICTSQVEGTDLGTFVITAYNIANEADHPCEDTEKILAKGLNNYYCSDFLADIIMQGSGVDNNNNFIQIDWRDGKKPTVPSDTFFTYVPYITTRSGQRLEDGVSIAVDPSVIPLNSWVYIESIGWRRADDTGGAIKGKRIDVFMNAPRKDAMSFGKKSLNVVLQEGAPSTSQQKPEATKKATSITLTLYIHNGSVSGPVIPGAQIAWQDGSGKSLLDTADSNGIITLNGFPGAWSFTASAEGYEANSWDQEITETCTKHAFLQESAASIFSLNLQEVNAEPNPAIPGSVVTIKVTLSKANDDDNSPKVIAVVKSPEGVEISRVAMKHVTGYIFQGIWNANFGAGLYKIDFIASTDKATKTFENALEVIIQNGKKPVTPTTKIAPALQGSGDSVVGKWKVQNDLRCDGHFAKDMMSIITFKEDGTAVYEGSTGSDPGYVWKQSGNKISWSPLQASIYRGDVGEKHQLTDLYQFFEGTINGDTMSGKWDCPSSPNPYGTYGCWEAVRID